MTAAPVDRDVDPARLAAGPPTSGWLRWARGVVVGATAGLLAVGAHVLAAPGGLPLRPAALVGALAVVGAVALSGQRWRLPSLLAVLVGMQVVGHLVLAGAGPGTDFVPTETGHGAGHAAPSATSVLLMVGAHLAAVLLTALVLLGGESVCWRLGELVSRPARRALRLAALSPMVWIRRDPAVAGWVGGLRPQLWSPSLRVRGPPLPDC